MEVEHFDEALRVLNSSLSQIKWRLKSTAKRKLEIDILALCTGMRPVVMIDYGGKMPELQERLLSLLRLIQKESPVFEHLRVLVIEEMIYLIHVRGLAEHVNSSLNQEPELLLVDLQQDPPKMRKQTEERTLGMQFTSIQKLFSLTFPLDERTNHSLPSRSENCMADTEVSVSGASTPLSSQYIDLSCCMQDSQVTVPTLNGWLLGYPVVYAFSKDHIADATYNLTTKSLRIYKILICRNWTSEKVPHSEELMSFSVPYDLSMGGSKEPWAEAFLAHLQSKWEHCKHVWGSLKMEVTETYPQSIVL